MQKDIHFYLTYALAKKLGVGSEDAEKLAWANQYTDELTESDLHEIQTQSAIVGNWADRQIQLSVLVPFHFIPGSDADHPWMTTPNNKRARALVRAAKDDRLRLGIALHGFQDTFSHQSFSGWQEDLNSCFPWYFVQSGLPNVGHAELRVIPDVVNYVWTDPRTGKRIDNKIRTMSAAGKTFRLLARGLGLDPAPTAWASLKPGLRGIFRLDSYDRRVDELSSLSGDSDIDYAEVNARLEPLHRRDFIAAACDHLARALSLFVDLPWMQQ